MEKNENLENYHSDIKNIMYSDSKLQIWTQRLIPVRFNVSLNLFEEVEIFSIFDFKIEYFKK